MAMRKKRIAAAIGAVLAGSVLLYVSSQTCLSAWVRYGLFLDECPDGAVRQTAEIDARNLMRGARGVVRVRALGHYTTSVADVAHSAPVSRFTPSLALVAGGKETPLAPVGDWRSAGEFRVAEVELPRVEDGEYLLRAKVKSALGESQVDAPLHVFAPARVHVLTDRPLYEPGHTVRFRAVVLRARDLAPLDHRPGVWMVTSPSGESLMEEVAPAGELGVAQGSFPLDRQAETGQWHVKWVSGDASDEVAFTVEPFTLPRFRVEAEAARPFYRAHERPVVRGRVVYSSGAPVAKAALAITWSVAGSWPPPSSWSDGTGLPKQLSAGADGRFTLELPPVPDDLQGQATLTAAITASDATQDRVAGTASILLSEDAIAVSAVAELEDGLVEGFNNRLFIRATLPDGRVLSDAHLTVRRAWEPKDPGVNAPTDVDGVAALQVDPGPAVNVVIPPPPFRPPVRSPAVQASGATDLISQEEPPLADELAMESWPAALVPCARFITDDDEVTVGLRVDPGGAVTATSAAASPLDECVATTLKSRRLSPGKHRLYQVGFAFNGEDLVQLEPAISGVPEVPELVQLELANLVRVQRDCFAPTVPAGELPQLLQWRVEAKSREVALAWAPDPQGQVLAGPSMPCLVSRTSRLTLSKPVEQTAMGVARVSVTPPARFQAARPQATTMLGYEFLVTARKGDSVLGSSRLRLTPGNVPPLRLRATPVLVKPGDEVTIELLRGPSYSGKLPEKAFVYHGTTSFEVKVDEATRAAKFKLPEEASGWVQVAASSAKATLYAKPRSELSLALKPDKERFSPGEVAHLSVETSSGGRGMAAAVGLFGVDDSLSQLVALPGPDDMARLKPKVVSTPAFPGIDAQALVLGRVRGANASQATVLKVTQLPTPADLDARLAAVAQGAFDPVERLTDRFYVVLAELHAQARAWEASAPATEKMSPPLMAQLWKKAIAACTARKEEVTDAYGRPLRLRHLPQDLLALTDPRQVVANATRLPEDIENWPAWVAKEQP